MSGRGPTAILCDWVCSTRYEDIPDEVREEALRILYDEVGGMIAGATLQSCAPIVELVRALGGPPECTIIGHACRAPLLNAVMVNGAIGHADEVDPTSVRGAGHFAATIVPAALTMGQYVGVSGLEFLRAFIIGAEVAARMQSTLNTDDKARPQFYYSAGAALGAAATAGLMLHLNAEKLEHAMGAAAMGSAPLISLHQEELHQIKALAYSGRTARAGVESALLAQHNLHSPREILTTENGFFHAFAGNREAGQEVIADLGKNYVMKDLLYKRYSVGGPNLAPLYAYLQLMKRHGFKGDDVEQIEVVGGTVYGRSVGVTSHHPSINTETVLALAACYGEYTFNHAHDLSYYRDPRFKAFQKRTRVAVVPREGAPSVAHRLQANMTVRTRNGGFFQQEVSYPLMTQSEIEQKFQALVGLRLDKARVMELDRKLKNVEKIDNVAKLVSDLEVPA